MMSELDGAKTKIFLWHVRSCGDGGSKKEKRLKNLMKCVVGHITGVGVGFGFGGFVRWPTTATDTADLSSVGLPSCPVTRPWGPRQGTRILAAV